MRKLLIGGAALVVSVAACAQVAPAPTPKAPRAPFAQKVQTRAEVQAKVAEHFARMDTNRDGFVTKAEADAASEALHAKWAERRDERGDRTFEKLDTNKDGAVSRGEWDARQAQREQRIADRGDRGPMKSGFHHGGMGGFGGHMFDMADANHDGRVSLQEAQAAALQHFDMVDANHDGQITPEERMQMHQRMRSAPHQG
jgi:Skp family chaperone for outer membrane proteins